MSTRRVLFYVPLEHNLQSGELHRRVAENVSSIVEKIERILQLSEKPLSFKIDSAPSDVHGDTVVDFIVSGPEQGQNFRLLYSDLEIKRDTVRRNFNSSSLIVVANEKDDYPLVQKLDGAIGCKVRLQPSQAVRFTEDLFIDIFMGRLLVSSGFLSEFGSSGSLKGLFKQKVKFYKEQVSTRDPWLRTVSKSAEYVPLVALARKLDDDLDGRAKFAVDIWREFSAYLSAERVAKKVAKTVAKPPRQVGSIAEIRDFGRQLSLRKIENVTRSLPVGGYLMLVLRRSSMVRKNPKTRNKIKAIFGPRARINSFRFIPVEQYRSDRERIVELITSGYVAAVELSVNADSYTIENVLRRRK